MQTGTPQESTRTEEFETSTRRCQRAVQILTVPGRMVAKEAPCCPCCGQPMEGNGSVSSRFGTYPSGWRGQGSRYPRPRWACRECGQTSTEEVPFRAPGQRITLLLLTFVHDLLALGQTFKAVSLTAGLNRNVVKKIDRARLSALYTEGEGKELKLRKPERQARYLGADKFKLHNARRWATVI